MKHVTGLLALMVTAALTGSTTYAQEGSARAERAGDGRLFFLDFNGRVLTANPDGSQLRAIVEGLKESPDGIDVDTTSGFVYWSNMGRAADDDGSVERAMLDGTQHTVIVPKGGMHTAKPLKIDRVHGRLYWSDREGMRVMRSNIDGSHIETLVEVAQRQLTGRTSRFCSTACRNQSISTSMSLAA